MKSYLDKLGSFGAVIAAAACPICFPKLALLGAFFGLGGLAAYESQLIVAAQALVVLATAGHVIAYRSKWLLALALAGAITFFAGLYAAGSEFLAYCGLAALVAASAIDLWLRLPRRQSRS
jgi:mercuric ion transport protein